MSTRRADAAPQGVGGAAAPLLLRADGSPHDPAAPEGGRLDSETVEALVRCEQEGVPSVLWVESLAALDSSAAALVTHVAVCDPALHVEAAARFGTEQALLTEDAEAAVRAVAAQRRVERDRLAAEAAPRRGAAEVGSLPRRIWRRLRHRRRGAAGR